MSLLPAAPPWAIWNVEHPTYDWRWVVVFGLVSLALQTLIAVTPDNPKATRELLAWGPLWFVLGGFGYPFSQFLLALAGVVGGLAALGWAWSALVARLVPARPPAPAPDPVLAEAHAEVEALLEPAGELPALPAPEPDFRLAIENPDGDTVYQTRNAPSHWQREGLVGRRV